MTTAIRIEGISKMFRLYRERPTSVKQRLLVSRSRSEEFWALRDVAFDVADGSSLGFLRRTTTRSSSSAGLIACARHPSTATSEARRGPFAVASGSARKARSGFANRSARGGMPPLAAPEKPARATRNR